MIRFISERSVIKSHHLSAILTTSEAISNWSEADFLIALKEAAFAAQMTPVGELAFSFSPQGISAVILLAESHVALHFWPEKRKLTIDIHVCDYYQDNQEKANSLATLLTLKMSENSNIEKWNCLSITG